jgi:hypothetical protein
MVLVKVAEDVQLGRNARGPTAASQLYVQSLPRNIALCSLISTRPELAVRAQAPFSC